MGVIVDWHCASHFDSDQDDRSPVRLSRPMALPAGLPHASALGRQDERGGAGVMTGHASLTKESTAPDAMENSHDRKRRVKAICRAIAAVRHRWILVGIGLQDTERDYAILSRR